ncbi:hypothetical protein PybrP1_010628 [[Pythium] brassicae (nom. inval.)]|nr:hypothetical protein PybrP1_010628 [[Pythium] brassicae (nom. inval.)]
MDIRRLLHHPDDGSWFVIGETRSEAEMNDFRRSLKRNAIINTHLVNCTMQHDHADGADAEHKMKVQWTKCTSALCHPKDDGDDDGDDDDYYPYDNNNQSGGSNSGSDNDDMSSNQQQHQLYPPPQPQQRLQRQRHRKHRACPVQLRMSTCQLTFAGIVCQAYQHLSDEHDSAEPLQSCVTEHMKVHVVRMLQDAPDVKPMVIYKELLRLHRYGEFGDDLMPTKIQLRNALTYLRSRKLKIGGGAAESNVGGDRLPSGARNRTASASSRKRTFDTFSEGSASPPRDEFRLAE